MRGKAMCSNCKQMFNIPSRENWFIQSCPICGTYNTWKIIKLEKNKIK